MGTPYQRLEIGEMAILFRYFQIYSYINYFSYMGSLLVLKSISVVLICLFTYML